MREIIQLSTDCREELVDITPQVATVVTTSGVIDHAQTDQGQDKGKQQAVPEYVGSRVPKPL